ELPDLEDPLAYLLGRYRSVGDLPITADGAGAFAWTVHLAPGAEGSRFADQATAAAVYDSRSARRRSASASMIRPRAAAACSRSVWGRPARRGGCRQPLGLGSAGLAAPLVPSGRVLVQLRVPAVHPNLEVGGFAPLLPGLGESVRGRPRPTRQCPGRANHRAAR